MRAWVVIVALLAWAAPAAATEFVAPVGEDAYPLALTGDAVLLGTNGGLDRLTANGRTRISTQRGMRAAAGSSERIVAQTGGGGYINIDYAEAPEPAQGEGDGYGEHPIGGFAVEDVDQVLAGPATGPLTEVDRCPTDGRPEFDPSKLVGPLRPVAAGAMVAWRTCGHRAVAVRDGHRSFRIQAHGVVVGLAAEGRRLAWADVRDGHRTRIRTMDLDSAEVTDVGTLKPLSPSPGLGLSLGSAGRLRATLYCSFCGGRDRCTIRDSVDGGPLVLKDTLDCSRAQLADGGSVGRAGRRLVVHDEVAGTARTLARLDEFDDYEASATQVVVQRAQCDHQTLVVRDLATTLPRLEPVRCPVRLERAYRSGSRHVKVTVTCPRGCVIYHPRLSRHDREVAESARNARLGPGGSATFKFRLRKPVTGRLRLEAGLLAGKDVSLPITLR